MARILVAEDEPTIRTNVVRFLVGLGHEVRAVANGSEAMRALDEDEPDLLVTDINMPDMDGIELLNALRRRGSGVPVIAISGGGTLDRSLLLQSASLLGAVTTLEKPFALGDLQQAVAEALPADA